jgi:hypothetical protein
VSSVTPLERATGTVCAYRTATVIVMLCLLVQDARRVPMKDLVSLANVHPVYLGGTERGQGVVCSVMRAARVTGAGRAGWTARACAVRGGPHLHALVAPLHTMGWLVMFTVTTQHRVVVTARVTAAGRVCVTLDLVAARAPIVRPTGGTTRTVTRTVTRRKRVAAMGYANNRDSMKSGAAHGRVPHTMGVRIVSPPPNPDIAARVDRISIKPTLGRLG